VLKPEPGAPMSVLATIPRGVWVLGFVSLLMDVSSEMIHALLPVFLVTVLGASVTAVGLIEGMAEATASIAKIFSGTLSDRLRKRKRLAGGGYALSALSKPLFALAGTVGWVFAARFVDRVGKGIRGAPRDALLADITPPQIRGASFGLRQALDTAGAVAGPVLAIACMSLSGGDFRLVFWLASIPAAAAVWLLWRGVQEPTHATPGAAKAAPWTLAGLRRPYWCLVVVAALFTLARFSEAFLVLKVAAVGLDVRYAPLVFIVMNVSYALSAYPAGQLSDRRGRWTLLAIGLVLLAGADVLLAFSNTVSLTLVGVAVWGLHLGFTQGSFSALVADATPPERRGTGFGLFSLVSGLVLLAASLLAGLLWDLYGPRATFLAGAGIALMAGVVALALHRARWLPRNVVP
jgi:MFS family permease